MKKTICLLIMIISMIVSVAVADEFTLHSGVTFGMSADEIVAKQKERGNTFSMTTSGRMRNLNKISILGIDAEIYYDFNENGKMIRQQYSFQNVDFTQLAKEFERVYGKPDCSSLLGTQLILPEKSFDAKVPTGQEYSDKIYKRVSKLKPGFVTGIRSDITTYQWLIEVDNGFVVIEEYGYQYYSKVGNTAKENTGSLCFVDYRFFTKEEMEANRADYMKKYDDI